MKIIYDGECPVCISLKEFSQKQISNDQIEFIPFQDIKPEDKSLEISLREASHSIFLIEDGQPPTRGAAAVFEIMQTMPGIWGAAGKFLAIPPLSWFAEPCYRLFARYRHIISRWLE
jgi:predicted DCC family thiol-disulfide oxidoreductase YuxK